MSIAQIIISNQFLSGLKVKRYVARQGEGLSVKDTPYPAQRIQEPANMTGDSYDASPKSYLGTPVFADVRFPRKSPNRDIVLQTVIVEIAQRKNIVMTTVTGRNGTIKEYINDGDYEIRIRGAVVTEGASNYPYLEVRELHELLKLPEPLEIVAEFLRLFDIYSVVVTGFSFPQVEGKQNTQFFEIECVSDLPDELIIE